MRLDPELQNPRGLDGAQTRLGNVDLTPGPDTVSRTSVSKPAIDEAGRKSRGAFFTPAVLADELTMWAIRTDADLVLEPSCGEASFLASAGRRLRDLGSKCLVDQLHGVEMHHSSAARARSVLSGLDIDAQLFVGDFYDYQAPPCFDAVVGNPPYVRYQGFTGLARLKAQQAALAQGVRLTKLASSWAAFVIQAASFLKPDGRLGLVLPAELLSVNYARDVRRYLMSRFKKVELITFTERVFPDVMEEVVLLRAEGLGPTDHFEIYRAADLEDLNRLEELRCVWVPPDPYGKWTAALIDSVAGELYAQVSTSREFAPLQTWGETSLGMVTGNNKYFTLTAEQVGQLQLSPSDLLPIAPPGSRHLRGISFTSAARDLLTLENGRVYLFNPSTSGPSPEAARYIEWGEEQGVDGAYKCRVRAPWWKVPLVEVPDMFLTYMNHLTPRLIDNRARVRQLNSVHGVYLREEVRGLGKDLLVVAALNTVTMLGAELLGRSYGGGILKVEPKEADLLPVPSSESLSASSAMLREIQPDVVGLLNQGALLEAVEMVDCVLLIDRGVLNLDQLGVLRRAREDLFARRQARSGNRNVKVEPQG